jgi:LmbE family N-acetylglucosaminyl deacetylase
MQRARRRLGVALRMRRVRLLRALAARLDRWSAAAWRAADAAPPASASAQRRAARVKSRWPDLLATVEQPGMLDSLLSLGVLGDDLPRLAGPPRGRRVLVLAAHQDDEIIGAGGTLLLCARAGVDFEVVYYTDGATAVGGVPADEVATARQEEARRVWRRLAGVTPVFWDYPNRAEALAPDAPERLAETIAAFAPDTIFVPTFFEQPVEHRRVNELLLEAHALSQLPAEIEIWGYQITTRLPGNRAVDITPVWKQKYKLNRRWSTQNAHLDYAHLAMGRDIAASYYLKGQVRPPAAHAELFLTFDAPTYLELAGRFARVPERGRARAIERPRGRLPHQTS